MATVYLNGTQIETYGLSVSDMNGWLDVPQQRFATVDIPLRYGTRVLPTYGMTNPRVFSITVYVVPTSFADRRTKMNALFAACRGRVALSTDEDPTKVVYGYLEEGSVNAAWKAFLNPQVTAELKFVCFDPLWYDAAAQTQSITSTSTTIPIGTAMSRRATITITGAATNPILRLKNAGGTLLSTMTLTGTLASGNTLTIDLDAFTIKKNVSGTITDVISWLGTTESFFELNPSDGPKLELTSGTGSLSIYRGYYS